MLIKYTAKKGIKLYGDETFCMSPPEISSPRNLLTNGDLRYGLYGWVGSSTNVASIVSGLLRVTGAAGAYARQLVETVSGESYYYKAVTLAGSVANTQVRVLDGTTLATIYDSGSVPSGISYGSWFVATSNSVYFELLTPTGATGTDYCHFKGLTLSEYKVMGASADNLVPNAYFPDTVGWTAESGAILLASGGDMTVENGTATSGKASAVIQVTAGLMYKLQYSFYQVVVTNANIAVGTVGARDAYGGTISMTHSKLGYVYFVPTASGDCYITLENESTTVGHKSGWGSITVMESNATVADGEFRVSTSQWVAVGSWVPNGLGQATITGGYGDTLSQTFTNGFVVGRQYTLFFRLTVPSDNIKVELLNVNLATSAYVATYTVSGYYSVVFIAEDVSVTLTFTSQTSSAVLLVEQVTGGLSVAGINGISLSSLIEGRVGSAVSGSNTGTPCTLAVGNFPQPNLTEIESGIRAPVFDEQQVGTADFTYCGWLYTEPNSGGFFMKRGDEADGAVFGYIDYLGNMAFLVSQDGLATYDLAYTDNPVTQRWVFWELVRSGSTIFIRVNGEAASPVAPLSLATGSHSSANGYNYVGAFPFFSNTSLLSLASHVRFIPSAVSTQRSRTVYSLEKDMFKADEKYAVVDNTVELLVASPTSIGSKTSMVGTTVIPDSGKYQETTVNRMDDLLSAASKELDYFELIEFKAFLSAVVQGGLFEYDAYAVSDQNYINNLEVFLVGNSVAPARQGSLELFIVSWNMRRRGGY